jgi:hypothetical protein
LFGHWSIQWRTPTKTGQGRDIKKSGENIFMRFKPLSTSFLIQLLDLWEKNKYFNDDIMEVKNCIRFKIYTFFYLFYKKLRDIPQARKHFEVMIFHLHWRNSVFFLIKKDAIRTEYAPIIEPIENGLDEKYAQLEKQHADFSMHIQTQISQIQQQIIQFHQVQQQTPPPPPPHLLNNTFGIEIIYSNMK